MVIKKKIKEDIFDIDIVHCIVELTKVEFVGVCGGPATKQIISN
jgi:hypothetical protein